MWQVSASELAGLYIHVCFERVLADVQGDMYRGKPQLSGKVGPGSGLSYCLFQGNMQVSLILTFVGRPPHEGATWERLVSAVLDSRLHPSPTVLYPPTQTQTISTAI